MQQWTKQKFDYTFINKVVKIFNDAVGGEDYIVAYGDGSFLLAINIWLVEVQLVGLRIVMTNDRTTKACPHWQK